MYKQFLKEGFKVQTHHSWDEYRLHIRAYNSSRVIWSHGKDTYLDETYAQFPQLSTSVIDRFEHHLAWLLAQPLFIITKDLTLEEKTILYLNHDQYQFDLQYQVKQLNMSANETQRINILTQVGISEGTRGRHFAELHFHRMECTQGTGAGLLQRMERAVTIDTFLLDN